MSEFFFVVFKKKIFNSLNEIIEEIKRWVGFLDDQC